MAEKSFVSNTKEIYFSNPSKITSFYKNQHQPNVIFDSSYSNMIGMNKIESEYVIPITKNEPKPLVTKSMTSTQVRVIDPNTAIVNQAKENIKNDMAQVKPMTTVFEQQKQPKRKASICSEASKVKRPKHKRRKTIVGGDIFSEG